MVNSFTSPTCSWCHCLMKQRNGSNFLECSHCDGPSHEVNGCRLCGFGVLYGRFLRTEIEQTEYPNVPQGP